MRDNLNNILKWLGGAIVCACVSMPCVAQVWSEQNEPLSACATITGENGVQKRLEITGKRHNYKDADGNYKKIDVKPTDLGGGEYGSEECDLPIKYYKNKPKYRVRDRITDDSWTIELEKTWGYNAAVKSANTTETGMRWEMTDGITGFEVINTGHSVRSIVKLSKKPPSNTVYYYFKRVVHGNCENEYDIDGKIMRVKRKGEKKALYWFDPPIAWDSSMDTLLGISTPQATLCDWHFVPTHGNEYELAIVIDSDWLDKAVYPIYIDPTLTLQPDATEGYDNMQIRKPDPLINCGADNGTNAGNWLGCWGGSTAYLGRHLIKFDISSIPNGATIDSAYQTLWAWYTSYNGSRQIWVHRILRDWGEGNKIWAAATDGESSWNHYAYPNTWTTAGADGAGTDIVSACDDSITGLTPNTNPVTFSVKNAVQYIANGATNYGWRLRSEESTSDPGSNNITGYYSSDWTTAGQRPKLVVYYSEAAAAARRITYYSTPYGIMRGK